jgi:hypothetical protein
VGEASGDNRGRQHQLQFHSELRDPSELHPQPPFRSAETPSIARVDGAGEPLTQVVLLPHASLS